ELLFQLFDLYEKECVRCLDNGCILPAYDYCLKCSHTFNLLDSRGAISVTQRVGVIARVRSLAVKIAKHYVEKYEEQVPV
ncbi:glycine--tRNA ligase subunit alpha, partial [Acidobacteria bacterium AH-259-D05]|nr:glycine--tRNA ligase subunit alpha [Acidobacteria bacterium AH-259-D05]